MRHRLSGFVRGTPALGLLLLRLMAGIVLIEHGVRSLVQAAALAPTAFAALLILLGLLLLAGLWTSGAVLLVIAACAWEMAWHASSGSTFTSMAVIAAALGLLGPGAWSLDAQLYGWRQIEIPQSRAKQDPQQS